MRRFKDNKAFTLIELIVVVAVLGILVLLAAPKFLGHTEEAQLVRIQHDVKVMENKMTSMLTDSYEEYNSWKNNSKDLGALIIKDKLFEKEGLAKNISVEYLSFGDSVFAGLDDNEDLAMGGELFTLNTSEESSLDPSLGYKIIPEEVIDEIKTNLPGTFYANGVGKVYYEHDKPLSSIKEEQALGCVAAETLNYEFDGSTGTIVKYNGTEQFITIPGAFLVDGECVPVKVIGPGAFMNGNFKKIVIPESVKEIHEDAFKDNELVEITIPHSVERINDGSFADNKIEKVVIIKDPSKIVVSPGAFENNGPAGDTNITPEYRLPTPEDVGVIFNPDTGTIIGSKDSNKKDTSKSSEGGKVSPGKVISIPEKIQVGGVEYPVKEVEKGAFQGEGIIYVEFPLSLERIEDYAFAGNQIIGLDIPENILHIGNYAFAFNEINEERTIKYVKIVDDVDHEPKIDKLGNIAEGGTKVDLLYNQVTLLDHIFVTSKGFDVPEDYNPIEDGGDNSDEDGPIEDGEENSDGEDSKYVLATDDDFNGAANGNFRYTGDDEYVEIPHTIKGVKVTSYNLMFSDSNGAITDNVKGVKSTNKNVTSMTGMFRDSQATTLDLSSFDTSNVTNMSQMFLGSRATTLDLSSFDTSGVTNMANMFNGSQATTLDLSSFDTSLVSNMSGMFYGLQATTLDLSSFDTRKVTSMSYMFAGSQTTTGYARTQYEADKFNATSDKPANLDFRVKR